MSEQKMPALPDADDFGCGDLYWNQDSVERIQREAYEAGRQHERERLEPLRVAVEALNKEQRRCNAVNGVEGNYSRIMAAMAKCSEAARTLLEQTE